MLDIQVTKHALERFKERGIKKKQALKLLRAATLSYRSQSGAVIYKNGELLFAVREYKRFWRLLTVMKIQEEMTSVYAPD